ncbi:MAG: hypothetical protein AAF268_15705 [Cyanobacteria bacterium P01_A01_bin.3]
MSCSSLTSWDADERSELRLVGTQTQSSVAILFDDPVDCLAIAGYV